MTKTQSKHTPGPWTQERNPSTNYTFNIWADGIRVAEVFSGPTHIQKDYFGKYTVDLENLTEGAANARLIAAAPELLEALIDIQKRINESDFWWMSEKSRGGFDAEAIDAAIAKAKGE